MMDSTNGTIEIFAFVLAIAGLVYVTMLMGLAITDMVTDMITSIRGVRRTFKDNKTMRELICVMHDVIRVYADVEPCIMDRIENIMRKLDIDPAENTDDSR